MGNTVTVISAEKSQGEATVRRNFHCFPALTYMMSPFGTLLVYCIFLFVFSLIPAFVPLFLSSRCPNGKSMQKLVTNFGELAA